jgi:hypothetical protein
MIQRLSTLLGISLLVAAFAFAQSGRTIQVDVNYTGSGTVDASHKIYVALWDSADFSGGPAAVKGLESKNGSVKFTDIQKSPVFVSAAYDPAGKWEAQSPPPSGSSLGMYASKPPTPDPITTEPGKTAKVKLAFDDSNKVP